MSSILVTLATPEGRHDLVIPADVPIGHLMAEVAAVTGSPTAHRLWHAGGHVLDESLSLDEAGIVHGTVLSPGPDDDVRLADRSPEPLDPRARTTRVPPDLPGGWERPTAAGRPISRARSAWPWTDRRRRLDWLLGGARPNRSVVIGVVGHRSAEMAMALARAMRRGRPEGVVLVDADVLQMTLSRGHLPQNRPIARGELEASPRRRGVTTAAPEAAVAQTPTGLQVVVMDPHRAPPGPGAFRRLLRTAANHWGIVVVDIGRSDLPNVAVLDVSAQVVVSRSGGDRL